MKKGCSAPLGPCMRLVRWPCLATTHKLLRETYDCSSKSMTVYRCCSMPSINASCLVTPGSPWRQKNLVVCNQLDGWGVWGKKDGHNSFARSVVQWFITLDLKDVSS
jgi:hypothetical protein